MKYFQLRKGFPPSTAFPHNPFLAPKKTFVFKGLAFCLDSPFREADQGHNPARSFRGISFFMVRPEIIGYRKGELFEVTTVLIFGSVHAERDVFGV